MRYRSGSGVTRRTFLRSLAGSAAVAMAMQNQLARASSSPNERIHVGVIGCGGMGSLHLANLKGRKDVSVVAVCDVSCRRYDDWQEQIGSGCTGYQDFRRVLDRPDIDAVWVATPDHWHAMIAILACQAGKDVYVEKPMTATVAEGRALVEAARRYGRVVQAGLQQRSMEAFEKADALIQGGAIGDLVRADTWGGVSASTPIEHVQVPPGDLDWEMWLGPAPWVPYSPERFGGFRAFRDYAGGELTNWGVHLIDSALMTMRKTAPISISPLGTSPHSAEGDDHEVINVTYEFDGPTLTWQQGSRLPVFNGRGVGNMFEGTAGRLIVDRSGFVVEPDVLGIPEFRSPGDFFIQLFGHHDNFLECVRTRERPRADCEIAHRSTTVCHLGNIALECGRKLAWDGEAERFTGDEQADRYLSRAYRAPWHL